MPLPPTPELSASTTDVVYFVWSRAEKDLRAFLLATTRGMKPWFAEREAAAESTVGRFDPETSYGDEGYNEFMDDVGIFWTQYWEQLAASVIKDAFKLFEIFLESSAQRILAPYGSGLVKYDTDGSWNFNEATRFYRDYLDYEVLPAEISGVKWIRDKLSHLDQLRTQEGKQQLRDHLHVLRLDRAPTPEEKALDLFHDRWAPSFGPELTFSPVQTWRVLELLRAHVNRLAEPFQEFTRPRQTGRSAQPLINLANGIAVNPRISSSIRGDSAYLRVPSPFR
jgi:hypothetical protein